MSKRSPRASRPSDKRNATLPVRIPTAQVLAESLQAWREIGRFMSADPAVQAPAFTQSFNRYSYVFNDPLSSTDRSGFQSIGTVEVTGSKGLCWEMQDCVI